MKILFWTPIFWPDIGGIELVSMRLIQSLKSRDFDFVVLTSHGRVNVPDQTNLNGTPIFRFPIISAFNNKDLRSILSIQKKLRDIKETYKPHIEHLNFGGPTPMGYFYLKTASAAPARLIVTLRASVHGLDGSAGAVTGDVLRVASWVTGVSQAVLDDAGEIVPEIISKSSVVYNGIEETALQPKPLPRNQTNILCMGRLAHEKGFDLAIEAFAQLIKKYPQARMTIAGDGPSRMDLTEQVSTLNLEDSVAFLGTYDHKRVYDLINQASFVIVPTRVREAFGQVASEASQMARPVIASRLGGLPEAVLDRETGILVEPDDSRAIYEAMVWLIENPEDAIRMGKNGYRRAHTQFGWKQYVSRFESLYRKFGKINHGS